MKKSETVVIGQDISFEAMIPIGDPVLIELKGKRYNSVLRGAMHMKYVIVDIPKVGGKPLELEYNAMFNVRFLISGHVYGFRAGLIRTHPNSNLLVLEYPPQVEKHSLRKSERLPLIIPAVLSIGTNSIKGAVLNISKNGLQVAVDASITVLVDQTAVISMTLPSGMPVESFVGMIKSVKLLGNKQYLGISFHEIEGDSPNTISSFYKECLLFVESGK